MIATGITTQFLKHPDVELLVSLVSGARSITTKESHLIQHIGEHWYAYPKLDLMENTTGGEAIMDGNKRLIKFGSAVEASCRQAASFFGNHSYESYPD